MPGAATGGLVVTAFPAASAAGVQALRAGGNAVDAAVAAAWALTVCEPGGSGLGGQTIALVRRSTEPTVIVAGHSRAPAAVSPATVEAHQQDCGPRACTVPTTPRTLAYLQQTYGRLPLARGLEAAIELAEEGFDVTPLHRKQLAWCWESLRASPAASALFLKQGQLYEVGERFRQPQLAATLRRLASCGVEDFYQGDIARRIAEDMRAQGGLMTADDLAECGAPREREPLFITHRDSVIASAPPPAGGLQILLGMQMLRHLAADALAPRSDAWYERLAEVIYTVFYERERWPVVLDEEAALGGELLSEERSRRLAEEALERRGAATRAGNVEEPGETTHLCAADKEGNLVSLTQSIQSLFGARAANPACGFLYNNYLTTCPRGDHPHGLKSRCLPRSNAAPTLALQGGRPVLTLGAAGSRRITSALLHVLSGVLDQRLPVVEAVDAPRIHAKLSRRVWVEQPAASASLLARLAPRFGRIQVKPPHSYALGAVQAIAFENGRWTGAADPRREGTVAEAHDRFP